MLLRDRMLTLSLNFGAFVLELHLQGVLISEGRQGFSEGFRMLQGDHIWVMDSPG